MPVMKPCIEPDCPRLVEVGSWSARCSDHQQQIDAGKARRGSTTAWRKLRAKIIRRDGNTCLACGRHDGLEVDHIDGDHTNNAEWNLQTLCHGCHRRKTNADRLKHPPMVLLIGRTGVGKTAVRQELAPLLGATSLGPDDFDDEPRTMRWPLLMQKLQQSSRAVVECVRVPTQLRQMLDEESFVVVLEASQKARESRLREKLPHGLVRRRTMQPWAASYGQQVSVDLRIDTTEAEPLEVARRIAARVAAS